MDKATLVKGDIDISARILDALSRTKIPVTFSDWHYVPQAEEWQLVIATPWVDQKGPRTTYRAVIDALTKASVYADVPMRRIFVLSPNDPIVHELEKDAKARREGFIHILRHGGSAKNEEYSMMFAPISGTGGAITSKQFSDLQMLRTFLVERLNLRKTAIEDAEGELKANGHTSIYPVHLSSKEAKRLGLTQ